MFSPGERILLDDGKLIFEVIATNKNNQVDATVIQGGAFKSNKGVNLPNTKISLPALTKKRYSRCRIHIYARC